MSAAYFGIITNENGMSSIYRYLLDFKKSSYSIVGKLRNNKDEMVMIKFLLTFDTLVDFFEVTNGRFKDVFNTISPVEEKYIPFYIDLIKRMTYIQSGCHPITHTIEDDERYYSSEDSLYTESDEDEEDQEDQEDEDKPITELARNRNYSCVTFVMSLLICGLIYIAHDESIQETIYKAHNDFRSSVNV